MKHILTTIISLSLLVSCGKQQKNDISKDQEVVSVSVAKTKKNNVTIDANGTANILMTSNDVMKFNFKKMTVKAGQKVILTLKHTGKLDKRIMGHNVVILQKGVKLSAFASLAAAAKNNDYIPEGSTDIIAHTKMIGGGESATVEFTAPEAGTYDFICSFPAHFAMMKGKFIVE
ncbi:azurin [Polaribacter sp.]|nr:azurin [Polaribacter sp.]